MNAEHYDHVRDALAHLYDPGYRPSVVLCELMACTPQEGPLQVQEALIRAIEELRPSDAVPSSSRAWQFYRLLRTRFVLENTLESTAEQMNLSYSSTWRLQREAIKALTQRVSDRASTRRLHQKEQTEARAEGMSTPGAEPEGSDWSSYAKLELASLETHAPGAVSDVSEVLGGVLDLTDALLPTHHVQMEVGYVQPHLTAALHPSVLRQILIIAFERLARYSRDGRIMVFARLEDGSVKIALTGAVQAAGAPINGDLSADILPIPGVSVQAHLEEDHAFLWILLPSVGRTTVLAVDDNPDIVRFYRRATEGTTYRIVTLSDGQELFPAVEELMPDIIILDVVLPGADGWELLARLHKDPATHSIPVIVCTVIREERLARSLGAAWYLPKPVQTADLIQALNRALAQSPPRGSRAPTSSRGPC